MLFLKVSVVEKLLLQYMAEWNVSRETLFTTVKQNVQRDTQFNVPWTGNMPVVVQDGALLSPMTMKH